MMDESLRLQEVIDLNPPFHRWSSDKQQVFVTALNEDEELLWGAGPSELYQLLLVLFDARPGCILGSSTTVASREAAEVQAMVPPEYTSGRPVGELLEKLNIPYVRHIQLNESDDRARVAYNYYVSYEEERLADIEDTLQKKSQWEGPSRPEDIAIGRFLGYPEQVIQAWVDWDADGEQFLDRLSDEEVLERVDPTRELLEEWDVDATSVMKYLLPYLVPATVEDVEEQVFDDFNRFLIVGLVALNECDIRLLGPLLAQYRWSMDDL